MADNSSASLNIHECSWADGAINILAPGGPTVPMLDLEAWKWARKNERGESRGMSGRVKKRTRGSPSCEASATATRGGWMLILETIEAIAISLGRTRDDKVIIGGIDFDVVIQHTPLGIVPPRQLGQFSAWDKAAGHTASAAAVRPRYTSQRMGRGPSLDASDAPQESACQPDGSGPSRIQSGCTGFDQRGRRRNVAAFRLGRNRGVFAASPPRP